MLFSSFQLRANHSIGGKLLYQVTNLPQAVRKSVCVGGGVYLCKYRVFEYVFVCSMIRQVCFMYVHTVRMFVCMCFTIFWSYLHRNREGLSPADCQQDNSSIPQTTQKSTLSGPTPVAIGNSNTLTDNPVPTTVIKSIPIPVPSLQLPAEQAQN